MSSKIRLKRSGTAGLAPDPTSLEYGEVTLNYADSTLYFRKQDNTLGSITGGTGESGISRTITTFTPSNATTTFTVSGNYTVGYLDVYRNGVRLVRSEDYTATNGTTFTLTVAAQNGDIVEAVAHKVYPLVSTVARVTTAITATSGQTTFTSSGGYTLNYVDVYLNGVKLIINDDFTAANGSTIVLAEGAVAGDIIEIVAHTVHGLGDGYTKAEADAVATIMAIALGD